MESIIQSNKECFLCGRGNWLDKHHVLHGYNRDKADKDGLTVWLCHECHMNLHQRGWHDMELKALAEKTWCEHYGKTTEDFIDRYGKSYQ